MAEKTLAAGLILLAASLPAAAQGTGGFLDRLMAAMAAVPSRHDRFTEEKVLGSLTEALRSTGELTYRRPDHLEKITQSPQPERLELDGSRLVITEGDAAPRVVALDAAPALRVLTDAVRDMLAGDLAGLRRSYDVQASGDMQAWDIVLRPTDPGAARFLREVEIRGSGTALRFIWFVQANGDQDRMTIEAAR